MKKSVPADPPAPKRGRPRAFDRDAALDVAMRLFWQKGHEATSILDLTEAMGIGAPSLYAAFGSKDELYAEALRHYGDRYGHLLWARVDAATTARAAAEAYLVDSATVLTGCQGLPLGCMGTLASVGREEHPDLAESVRLSRAQVFARFEARLIRAIADGELPASTDVGALARFVQIFQSGMSILARDGATRPELEAAAAIAMAGWDGAVARFTEASRGQRAMDSRRATSRTTRSRRGGPR